MTPAQPKVSFAIPVLNSAPTINQCLLSIARQDYPSDCIEIILADGGSADNTLEIAKKYPVRIVNNPRRTGEAGKAAAIKASTGDIIALVDSDNLLPHDQWLRQMTAPFKDKQIVASEPWEYTWRAQDPAWTRYCALTGANDPLCLYLGNYDRLNRARDDWTRMPVVAQDQGDYLKVTLSPGQIPTIGANGFLVRRKYLGDPGDYLFDIDIPGKLVAQGYPHIAKVKIGIVHLYAKNTGDFVRKQRRRVHDYLFFKKAGNRSYQWHGFLSGALKFSIYTILILPVLGMSIRGYLKHRDIAWWLHPLACWITLWIYGWAVIQRALGWRPREFQRQDWQK